MRVNSKFVFYIEFISFDKELKLIMSKHAIKLINSMKKYDLGLFVLFFNVFLYNLVFQFQIELHKIIKRRASSGIQTESQVMWTFNMLESNLSPRQSWLNDP